MLHPLRTILEEIVLQGLTDFEKHVSVNPWMTEYLVKVFSRAMHFTGQPSNGPPLPLQLSLDEVSYVKSGVGLRCDIFVRHGRFYYQETYSFL